LTVRRRPGQASDASIREDVSQCDDRYTGQHRGLARRAARGGALGSKPSAIFAGLGSDRF